MNKNKLYQGCNKYIIADNVRRVFLFVPFSYLVFKLCVAGILSSGYYLDVSVSVSIILVFFCEGIAKTIPSRII